MASPRVCVLRAPGTNCDAETAHAFDSCGGQAERVHLFRLLERPDVLNEAQILCIPGGFSYGDDIGAGVVFGTQLRSRLGETIKDFLQADKLVLGICNGFQVLIKAGILPGGSESFPPDLAQPRDATLTWNENGKYTALWVHLQTASTRCAFLRDIDRIELPIAHAEGRLVAHDQGVIAGWRERDQIALVYRDPNGGSASADMTAAQLSYPLNPNGSTANIAGLCDPTGRVLGLMPHPERYLFATQHPQWTRRSERGNGAGAGLQIFRNAVEYFRAS